MCARADAARPSRPSQPSHMALGPPTAEGESHEGEEQMQDHLLHHQSHPVDGTSTTACIHQDMSNYIKTRKRSSAVCLSPGSYFARRSCCASITQHGRTVIKTICKELNGVSSCTSMQEMTFSSLHVQALFLQHAHAELLHAADC